MQYTHDSQMFSPETPANSSDAGFVLQKSHVFLGTQPQPTTSKMITIGQKMQRMNHFFIYQASLFFTIHDIAENPGKMSKILDRGNIVVEIDFIPHFIRQQDYTMGKKGE